MGEAVAHELLAEFVVGVVQEHQRTPGAQQPAAGGAVRLLQVGPQRLAEEVLGAAPLVAPEEEVAAQQDEPRAGAALRPRVGAVPVGGPAAGPREQLAQQHVDRRLDMGPGGAGAAGGLRIGGHQRRHPVADRPGAVAAGRRHRLQAAQFGRDALVLVGVPRAGGDGDQPGEQTRGVQGPGAGRAAGREAGTQDPQGLGHQGTGPGGLGGPGAQDLVGAVEVGGRGDPGAVLPQPCEGMGLAGAPPADDGHHGRRQGPAVGTLAPTGHLGAGQMGRELREQVAPRGELIPQERLPVGQLAPEG
ncbi:hypothetical protein ACRAR1_12220 [Streptomyces sanyensis]|uniref:hypothetical protein n=1 Tax=Streptomyces sanyensis TaxID=568869 RepID=UPI003D7706B0